MLNFCQIAIKIVYVCHWKDKSEIILQDDFTYLPVLGCHCELTLTLSPCLKKSYSKTRQWLCLRACVYMCRLEEKPTLWDISCMGLCISVINDIRLSCQIFHSEALNLPVVTGWRILYSSIKAALNNSQLYNSCVLGLMGRNESFPCNSPHQIKICQWLWLVQNSSFSCLTEASS